MQNVKKKALVCVLNWGLGHATRSIPIIKHLESIGYTVLIASDGDALQFLKKEFPKYSYFELPSYNVRYTFSPVVGTILSLFSLFRAITQEKLVIDEIVYNEQISLIISDNRYGAYSKICKSYIITHQLNPFFFIKPRFLATIFEKIVARKLNCFDKILIPDDPDYQCCGKMLDNKYIQKETHFIGILNRFSGMVPLSHYKPIDILVILSGPEPTRTEFEHYILSELKHIQSSIVIVLGRIIVSEETFPANFVVKGFVDTDELLKLFQSTNTVISRSGYSSIMDYLSLGISAILIPTPRMPEQEYLAWQMARNNQFRIVTQTTGTLRLLLNAESVSSKSCITTKSNMFISIS